MASEKRFEVLTAVGSDRPGLVSEISTVIHELGANIEDSRMAVLGGEFALVMLLSGSPGVVAATREQGKQLAEKLGLQIFFKQTCANRPAAEAQRYQLEVSGLDHPGIVHQVADVLKRYEVNVSSLATKLVHAPLTGTPTFVMRGSIDVPGNVDIDVFRDALSTACEEENLDHLLEPKS